MNWFIFTNKLIAQPYAEGMVLQTNQMFYMILNLKQKIV